MHADPVSPYVVFRNHVTQAMAFAAAALFAALLALQPETGRRWRVVCVGRPPPSWLFSLVATTPGRSGYVVMAIVAIALAMTQRRGRARMVATAGVLAALVVATVASPLVLERFERGIGELRAARQSS